MCPTKRTGQQAFGLEQDAHALTAALPGTDTRPLTETPELVEERYDLALKIKRLERSLAPIDECLKRTTGERQTGAFMVKVSSFNVERIDTDAVKAMLGPKTPVKLVPTIRLAVNPA